MAYSSSTAAPITPGLLHRILTRTGDAIAFWASPGPMELAVKRLNAQSDADLAARGTTRSAEVTRIFGPRGLL